MNNQPTPMPMQTPLQIPERMIRVTIGPSDAFLSAAISLEDNEDFQTILKDLNTRVHELAINACEINDEKFSHWVAGRVQELRDLVVVLREARNVLNDRRTHRLREQQVNSAMS